VIRPPPDRDAWNINAQSLTRQNKQRNEQNGTDLAIDPMQCRLTLTAIPAYPLQELSLNQSASRASAAARLFFAGMDARLGDPRGASMSMTRKARAIGVVL
jgi:hypothetical protein